MARAITISGSVDCLTAASPPSSNCLRTAGSASLVPPMMAAAASFGERPASTAFDEGIVGPQLLQRFLHRIGEERLLERRIDRRGREQRKLQRGKLRIVIAVETLAVGFLDFRHVTDDGQPDARESGSANLSEALLLVQPPVRRLGPRDIVPRRRVGLLPLRIVPDRVAQRALVGRLLVHDLLIEQARCIRPCRP